MKTVEQLLEDATDSTELQVFHAKQSGLTTLANRFGLVKQALELLRNPPEISVFVVDYHEGVCETKITSRYYFPNQAADSAAIINMFAVNMVNSELSGEFDDVDVEPNEKGTIAARFCTGMENSENQFYWVVFGPDRADAEVVAKKILEEKL